MLKHVRVETQKQFHFCTKNWLTKVCSPPVGWYSLGCGSLAAVKLRVPKIGTTDSVFMCFRLNLADRIWVHKMDTKMGPRLHRFIQIEKGNRNAGPNLGPQYGPKNWPRNLHKKAANAANNEHQKRCRSRISLQDPPGQAHGRGTRVGSQFLV